MEASRPLPKPPSAAEAKGRQRYNFLAGSARDQVVFGSERPGQPRPNPDVPSTPRGSDVPCHVVDQWAAHMKSKQIQRVLCLLGDSELSFYEEPLLPQLRRHFGDQVVNHVAPEAPDAFSRINAVLDGARRGQEKIVVFCSTGQARTGLVLAYWVHSEHSLPIADAVTEVIEYAARHGAVRKPTVEQTIQFLLGAHGGQLMPSMRILGAGGGAGSFATPRVDSSMHINFVQMGGTIDKDYPRMTGGYAFEITDPAVRRILSVVPRNFTFDVLSVCRKDSQELTVEDRQALVEMIRRTPGTDFIVTHGTDTMIETAQYVAAAKGLVDRRVVVTGAMRPQKMMDSDASFNIGVAVGALNVIGVGVYVTMNGRVHPAHGVRRDGRTGHFVSK